MSDSQPVELPTEVVCRQCDGRGYTIDYRVRSITHTSTKVRRKCRLCKGTGVRPLDLPVAVSPDTSNGVGEIPEWMLESPVTPVEDTTGDSDD